MTTGTWLKAATKQLEEAGIGTARLDCLILLEDITGKDRTHLLAYPETLLPSEQQDQLAELLTRRANHEPLAYIREKTEFYGREFTVNKFVLEPRPESETMIDLLKQLPLPSRTIIVDVGTGSGALAITAKLEAASANVFAVDIDPHCLEVARANATKHEADVTFLKSNLLASLDVTPDVILANLPYVPDSYHINEAAMEEPRLAIFGGEDGLELYREMFDQIDRLATKPHSILTESLPFQHDELRKIAAHHGYSLTQEDDFIQLFSLA